MSKRNKRGSSRHRTKISFKSVLTFDVDTDRYSKRWLYETNDGRTFIVYAENPHRLLGVEGATYEVYAAGWFDRRLNVVIGAYDLCDFTNPDHYQDGRKATQ